MVVDGGLRAGRDDQRRESETAITGAIEKPGADPGTHASIRGRFLILLGKPGLVGQQFGKMRPNRGQDLTRVIVLIADPGDFGHERAKSWVVDDILILSSLDGGSHRNPLFTIACGRDDTAYTHRCSFGMQPARTVEQVISPGWNR
jgi:hypothetical protein